MKKKKTIMYGNPYTGQKDINRKVIENSLKGMGKLGPYKVGHSVETDFVIYKWVGSKK